VDALPVTDVGKPYKLGLRARAAERVVAERLASVVGVQDTAGQVEDGEVVVAVTVDAIAAETVRSELARFAVKSRVEVAS
jgi:fatty-acyl-CoA synthase